MSMRCSVIVVAAGAGLRMGPGVPKQFRLLSGHPVLGWCLARFEMDDAVESVVVVVPEGMYGECKALADSYGFRKLRDPVQGGPRRQDSVWNGLKSMDPVPEMVAIHDGARPFPPSSLANLIARAADTGGAIPAWPAADALKLVRDDRVASSVDRTNLWAVQTPQLFRGALLVEALEQCSQMGRELVDDASAFEAIGKPVAIVEEPRINIKLTTPSDFVIAEAIIGAGGELDAVRRRLTGGGAEP